MVAIMMWSHLYVPQPCSVMSLTPMPLSSWSTTAMSTSVPPSPTIAPSTKMSRNTHQR